MNFLTWLTDTKSLYSHPRTYDVEQLNNRLSDCSIWFANTKLPAVSIWKWHDIVRYRIWFEPSADTPRIAWHRYVRYLPPLSPPPPIHTPNFCSFFQLQMQTKFDEAKIKSVRYPAFFGAASQLRDSPARQPLFIDGNQHMNRKSRGTDANCFSRDLSPICTQKKITLRIKWINLSRLSERTISFVTKINY